uniref:Uncharacterized protein n=1 Tax=Pelodiscus sinensis TaxID=13735 RepID=K7F706_PELSI
SAFGKSHLQILLNWGILPHHVVSHIFQINILVDQAWESYVCQRFSYLLGHSPVGGPLHSHLWRKFGFGLTGPLTSYLNSTHPDIIQQIIKRHVDHLQYFNFKVDSTVYAEAACAILSQLVNCFIQTLGLISAVKPSFMRVSKAHFTSFLTMFVNSKALSSIKIDDTPVDDPFLTGLVSNNSDPIKLLKMNSCLHVSPAIICVGVPCHGLRQLTCNDYILLSHKKHVNLEHLCIDAVSENLRQTKLHAIKKCTKHIHKVKIVIYFLYKLEFDTFFKEKTPVTHLYTGHAVSKQIGMNYSRLIKLVVCANGFQPLNDELICITKCCKTLTALGFGECEATCRDFIEFVKKLTLVSIMKELLISDNDYNLNQIYSEVSTYCGRMWFPDMRPTW